MTRTTRWFIPLAAVLLLVAGLASAQDQGGGELVLFNEDGQEVLRLAPDQLTTGLQTVPAGRYRLEVHGPGPVKLLLEVPQSSTVVLGKMPRFDGPQQRTRPLHVPFTQRCLRFG